MVSHEFFHGFEMPPKFRVYKRRTQEEKLESAARYVLDLYFQGLICRKIANFTLYKGSPVPPATALATYEALAGDAWTRVAGERRGVKKADFIDFPRTREVRLAD